MPLIKQAKLADHMNGVDMRRRDDLFRQDYLRMMAGGMDISMRGSQLKNKNMVVWNTIKSLAEEGVEVGQEMFDLFVRSYQLLSEEMSQMFWRARAIGVAPKEPRSLRLIGQDTRGDRVIEIEPGTAWFPVGAIYKDHTVVILFRVWKISSETEVDEFNSCVIGIAMNDLGDYFPELSSYVERIRLKASEVDQVKDSFAVLMRLLRPEWAREAEMAERAKRYSEVKTFGAWG